MGDRSCPRIRRDARAVTKPATLEDPSQLRLYLPKDLYAFPGHELRLYFENIVSPELIHQMSFKVDCAVGCTSRRYWSATFSPQQAGTHPLEIVVTDLRGKELLRGKTRFTWCRCAAREKHCDC